MKFKDYYETLGLAREASADDIKQAYRRLARKYHPDVSKEADAETRFKELGEAYEVLKDPEKRAAYDAIGRRPSGEDFAPPPGWDEGFEFHGRGADDESAGFGPQDHSAFFEALFGRAARGGARPGPRGAQAGPGAGMHLRGEDHHARLQLDLADAYTGARRSMNLRMPAYDEHGQLALQERTLEVNIPKGLRPGQQLRLAGQGGAGLGNGPAGDLFLEIGYAPNPRFRVDGRDVYVDLPLAPWEAALGAEVPVPLPDGTALALAVPAGSAAGRKLRLRGKGIPGEPAGDLYAVLGVVLPSAAHNDATRRAYEALQAAAGADFNPRSGS